VSKYTSDHEFMAKMGKLTDSQEKLIEALTGVTDAIQKGDFEQMQNAVYGANQSFNGFNQSVAEASVPDGAERAAKAAQSVSAMQVSQTIVGELSRFVSSLDRSGIVGQQGAGDIAGADIAETRRQAGLWGGLSKTVLTAVGALAGPAGAAAGYAIGSVPDLILNAKANEDATSEAYSKIWERQIPGSMELTALLGKYGGIPEQNTRNIRDTFSNAAGAAAEFGFSAEEGIEAVKQGAAQGLSEQDAIAAAKNVFAFERGIGADRQLALEFETRSRRFGMEDAMGWAYRGSQASGMAPGQFNEFLRSMQRVFEDGISKGFVRGTQEMAGNMAFLSDLNNGSELWKGEQGAQRLSQMNAGLESATGLSSATDILAYRGARDVWGKMTDDEKNNFLNVDGKGGPDVKRFGGDAEYINAMMVLERGLTPELFGKQMDIMSMAEGGSEAGIVERMRKMYGLNYTQAGQLYTSWQEHKDTDPGYFESETFKKELEGFNSKPPGADSNELDFSKRISVFQNKLAMYGQTEFDAKVDALPGKIAEELAKLFPEPEPKPPSVQESLENLDAVVSNPASTGDEVREATNAAIASQVEAGLMIGRFGNMLGDYFDAGRFGPKADKYAKKNATNIFSTATRGDENQVNTAYSLLDLFKNRKDAIIKEWEGEKRQGMPKRFFLNGCTG
jgi:hypothetical protein